MTKLELWCRCALLLSVVTKGSARSTGSEIYPSGNAASRVLVKASDWTVERIGETNVSFYEKNSEIVNVTMSFNMSDKFAGVIVYEDDCKTDLPDGTLEANLVSVDWAGEDDPFKTANIALGLNTSSIMGDSSKESFGFCVKGEVYELADSTNVTDRFVVNFHETVYNLTMDLNAEVVFDLNANVERLSAEGVDESITYSEFIDAYLCDEEREVTDPTPYSQGNVLNLCVTSKDDKVVTVTEISDLALSQGNGEVTFNAIEKSDVKYDSLVTSDGTNCPKGVCMVKVVLVAIFFSEEDPDDIKVSGSVKLEIAGAGTGGVVSERRYLEAASIERKLEASAVGFDLVLQLESAAAQADSSVGRKSMASAHILAVALYLMMS
jgi:hypothetical protein